MINLNNYEWEPLPNWDDIHCSIAKQSCMPLVGPKDIDNFVEDVIFEISDELNADYNEIYAIFKEKNAEFFEEKERLFRSYNRYAISKFNPQLIAVEMLFKVPVM